MVLLFFYAEMEVGVISKEIQCVKHGAFMNAEANFYMASEGSIFSGIGRIPICKRCLKEIVEDYYKKNRDVYMTIYLTCRKIDLAYLSEAVEDIYENGIDAVQLFQKYMTYMNSIGKRNGINIPFDLGEHLIKGENTDNKKSNDDTEEDEIIKMTEDEKRIKKEVIELIGRDPFKNYSIRDQKFLYTDLIGYLSDEDVLEDQFLISQIIQVVTNNLQINEINSAINKHMSSSDGLVGVEGEIDKLNNAKEKISRVNNNIAKESNLTVKSRGGSSGGRSSITQLMSRLRDLEFREIEEDYFSQEFANSMQRVANMSMKAISEQMKFDENDSREIIVEQRQLITDKDKEILRLEEELRQLHEKELGGNNE